MSITIALPRMSTDPELTTAQSKYVESLARADASVRWVELADPDKAVAVALRNRYRRAQLPACCCPAAVTLSPASSDRSASRPAGSPIPCGMPLSPSCSMHSLRRASPSSASAGASRC